MIYYIACTTTHRVKIGYTSGEPEVRLKQLQTGSASKLRLMACHEGDPEVERSLHEQFSEQRAQGEWFELSDPILEHMSAVAMWVAIQCIDDEQPAPFWLSCWLRALRDQNGFLPEKLEALA